MYIKKIGSYAMSWFNQWTLNLIRTFYYNKKVMIEMRPVFQVVKSLNELWSCIILAFSAVFCFFGCVEIYQIVSKHDGTWQNKWRWIAICRNIFLWNTSKVIRIDQSLSQYGNSFVAIFGDYRLQDLSISQVIVMWPVKNWSALIGGKFNFPKKILYKICFPVWMV